MIIRLSLIILGCILGCKSCNNLIINLICGAGRIRNGCRQSGQWAHVRPVHSGEGRYGGARDDMCYFIIDIFTLAPSVVFGNIDDTLYGRFVCRLQSGAGVDDSCGPWRRNVGRRLCADGFQFGECYRSLYRRPCLEWRLSLSRIGRRTVCTDGIYFIPCLLQEISGEVLSVSFFLCMFVRKY